MLRPTDTIMRIIMTKAMYESLLRRYFSPFSGSTKLTLSTCDGRMMSGLSETMLLSGGMMGSRPRSSAWAFRRS